MAALMYFVVVSAITASASKADRLVDAVNMAGVTVSREGSKAARADSSQFSSPGGAAGVKQEQPPSWQTRSSGLGQVRDVQGRDAQSAQDQDPGQGRTERQAMNANRVEVLSLLSLVESRISILASFLTGQYRALNLLGAKMDATRRNVSAVLTRLQQGLSANLSLSLNNLRGELSSQNNRLSSVDSRLGSVYSSMSSVDSRLSSVYSSLSSVYNTMSSVNSRLGSVESRLNSLGNHDGLLSSIRQEIANAVANMQRQTSLMTVNVRLVGSYTNSQGRVEISISGGAWGTVCDDDWDNNDATVVCRMLGYRSGVARGNAAFGQGTGAILLDDVHCSGVESNLLHCRHQSIGVHNCGHHEDAGAICSS